MQEWIFKAILFPVKIAKKLYYIIQTLIYSKRFFRVLSNWHAFFKHFHFCTTTKKRQLLNQTSQYLLLLKIFKTVISTDLPPLFLTYNEKKMYAHNNITLRNSARQQKISKRLRSQKSLSLLRFHNIYRFKTSYQKIVPLLTVNVLHAFYHWKLAKDLLENFVSKKVSF